MSERLAFVMLVMALLAGNGVQARAQGIGSVRSFAEALTEIAGRADDPCGDIASPSFERGKTLESSVFYAAAEILKTELNRGEPHLGAARVRVDSALTSMAQQSATINTRWSEGSRFRGTVLEVSPALVVTMGIRSQERFFVYGMREATMDKPQRHWEEVGEDHEEITHSAPRVGVSLFPLHRGPSGRPRFLTSFVYTGCAGSFGINYGVEEWDPREVNGFTKELLALDGSEGMDEGFDGKGPTSKDPFHPIGKLTTVGRRITLPYCWFSALDWWDNPNMCAVETYDVSGDDVAFVGRQYNRPELAAIAKALEYAGRHDLPAVRGYCASEKIARELVRNGSGFHFEDDITVRRFRDGRARVQEKYTPGSYFEVERRPGGWVITAVHTTE